MRTGHERIERISSAIAAGEAFRLRVFDAEGDRWKLADLMAEAIAMNREACGLEVVGRDGRSTLCMEELQSFYSLDAAREAYLRACGSNSVAV